jgi:glycosyltransferase involved in cell wall biosynthesis
LARNQEIQVTFLNEKRKASLRGLKKIYDCLRNNGTEILHVHGYKAAVLGGLVARLAKIPVVMTYHGEAAYCPELSTQVKIENFFIRKASLLIAVSNRIRNELKSRGVPDHKIVVIHNGIADLAAIKKKNELSVEYSKFSPHLISVGRLVQIKRFDLAINAVSQLKSLFPGIGLSIAGTGPLEETLRKQVANLNLDNNVQFLGYVRDVESLYSSADVMLLCSDTEGSPITLLEAMAFALPIIATSVGAIPEMVSNGKDVLLIRPGDLSQLVGAIAKLLNNSDLRRILCEKARKNYLKKYNSENMATKYMRIYAQVQDMVITRSDKHV